MTSPTWLTEIEERVAKATPGPWAVEEDWTAEILAADGTLIGNMIYPGNIADAFLMAHAPTDLTRLIADNKRLREALEGIDQTLQMAARAVENLASHQKQLDADGIMVEVSRQAVDECVAAIEFCANGARTALTQDER